MKGKERRYRLIISAAVLLAVLALTVFVLVRINSRTREHALEELKEAAAAADARMASLVDGTFSDLNGIAALQVSGGRRIDSPETAGIISGMSIGALGMEARLYLPDGSACTRNGIIKDVSEHVDYGELLAGTLNGRCISCCRHDYIDPERLVIEFYAPVRDGEETVAVISAVLDSAALPGYMASRSFGGSAGVLFIDARDGTVFIDTLRGAAGSVSFYESRTDDKGNSLKPFFERVLAGEESFTPMKWQGAGKVKYLYALPSQTEGWVSCVTVDENILLAESRSVSSIMFRLAFAELLICLAYFLWMFKYAKRQATSGSRKIAESFMRDYRTVYVVNTETDRYRILKADEAVHGIFSDDGLSFTDAMNMYAEYAVLKSDRNALLWETDYGQIRKRLGETSTYSVSFRGTLTGQPVWTRMTVSSYDGDEILIAFADRDREILETAVHDRTADDFFAIYVTDLDSGLVKAIKGSSLINICAEGSSVPLRGAMYGFASKFSGEEKRFFENLEDPGYISRELATEDKLTYSCKTPEIEGGKWVTVTIRVLYRHEDGSPAVFSMGFSFMDALGADRQELQSRVAEQNALLESQRRQLQDALSMAESANESKSTFLFNMSHDIRTPMNAIMGFTNMAIKHIDNREKTLDCLSKMQQSGNMLLSLINSVLEVSRIESGNAVLEEQYGDVFLSFVNIETTMRELAAAKDIDISFEISNIKDRFVYCDFNRCMRIFVNVISNAIKYTREGGYVKVRCEQAGEAHDGFGTYRYTVEDNGIGMSEEFQKHVFEQFSREKNATMSGVQGTGLGMAVCKSFVDLMGGTIECRSKQGAGTTFTITLPFRLQDGEKYTDPVTQEVRTSVSESKAPERIDFAGRRVLVVEDNELNREIAVDILEDEGFIVEEAEDGSVAVDLLREQGPDRYDFILMDIQMPVMNGFEATEAIRRMYPDSRLPIIALSANAFAEDKAASIASGMNDHVAKPINVKELLSCLAKFL